MTNNLSKSLQSTKMPAIKGKKCADLVIDTLRSMINDEDFDLFFEVFKRVRLLAMCRGELSAVIARLMSKCL